MKNSTSNLKEILLKDHKLNVEAFEESFLVKTIENRINESGKENIVSYINFVEKDKLEKQKLYDSLHVSYSEFFRNTIAFAYLEKIILPYINKKKQQEVQKELRIWSAGCAHGEEAISMAILLDEMSNKNESKIDYLIFATDIKYLDFNKLRSLDFNSASVSKVTQQRIKEYFISSNQGYTVIPHLYKYIFFSVFDLLSKEEASPAASIYGCFDVIFCSNLLFYYKTAERKKILEKISYNLTPKGYVITGDTEREIFIENGFKEVYLHSCIFQKKEQP